VFAEQRQFRRRAVRHAVVVRLDLGGSCPNDSVDIVYCRFDRLGHTGSRAFGRSDQRGYLSRSFKLRRAGRRSNRERRPVREFDIAAMHADSGSRRRRRDRQRELQRVDHAGRFSDAQLLHAILGTGWRADDLGHQHPVGVWHVGQHARGRPLGGGYFVVGHPSGGSYAPGDRHDRTDACNHVDDGSVSRD
jgi:hypothetical protein